MNIARKIHWRKTVPKVAALHVMKRRRAKNINARRNTHHGENTKSEGSTQAPATPITLNIDTHTHRTCTQTVHRGNYKEAPMRRRKRNTHAVTIRKEERWLTLSHAMGKKASSPPTGQMLCDCIRTVLHKGGFIALPHLRNMSQLDISQRPHSSKDRATQWVLRFPPPRGSVRAKSSGSITFYASRWGVATTEGNVMINANSTITRCVKIALEATCKEISSPVGLNVRATPSHPHTASLMQAPTNINDAIDQCVAFMGPEQAAAILAMKPNSAAPGEASVAQDLLTTLLQSKSSAASKRTSTHKR